MSIDVENLSAIALVEWNWATFTSARMAVAQLGFLLHLPECLAGVVVLFRGDQDKGLQFRNPHDHIW